MNYTNIGPLDRNRIAEALRPFGDVKTDEPMSAHTSFRTGGPARIFIRPNSADELTRILKYLASEAVTPLIIGNGTNVIFADEGFGGIVICIGAGLNAIERNAETLTAGAGALLSEAAAAAAQAGLSGFEALSGIPGTVGGAVYMNAGAYEHEIQDIVTAVTACSPESGELLTYGQADLAFAYRGSVFQRNGGVVTSVTFGLTSRPEAEIRADMRDYARRRRDKQPIEMPSAGSFFKRPAGAYAGALIEQAGLKGRSVGGARVSEKHAGFIVNTGGAATADILRLMKLVQDTVFGQTGIMLEPEPRIIGADG
ncbi:MAG: UDP-N-acetylmuramate dehydrogenase [Clostridiales Family XIII bacterium]|nr:UDP-N-acetylmuramate dehydrogenase [Clostridiales Family XIII bacterium]